ncbi:electron transfer flavoprotein subunit alpha/FixB family protein [Jonesiaceae bacterium BS-20]|uniref:Electron transfer flavoprotein subunit alpha/FixB family protein n=1 Tax=Jonesiaceae bacterium BS-20 TaxID=3120821 RepID=A0AAU7DWL9_9MICO
MEQDNLNTDAANNVVVLIDTPMPALRSAAAELLTLANQIGTPVAVALEPLPAEVVTELGQYGVERVLIANVTTDASPYLTPVAAEALSVAVRRTNARAVLAAPTFQNKELTARLAYELDAGLVVDTVTVGLENGNFIGYKRVFAGAWDVSCEVVTPIAVATVRANAVVPVKPEHAAATTVVESFDVTPSDLASSVVMVSRTEHPPIAGAAGRPKLAEAAHVVAGGRGTEGDFSAVEELADALGGAIGATRDAVDEGWIEHDAQIGQTGVTVAPRVYIGAGISGAPHHRGGMQASGVIVAVNSDPDAPIFEICDFAVIGELADVLPQAAEAIREYKASL